MKWEVSYAVVRKPWCSTNFLSNNSVGSETKNFKLMKTLPIKQHRHNWPKIVVGEWNQPRTEALCVVGWGTWPLWSSVSSTNQGDQPQEPGLCSSLVKRVGLDEVLLSFTARSGPVLPRGQEDCLLTAWCPLPGEEHRDQFSFPLAPSFWAPQLSCCSSSSLSYDLPHQ